MLTKGTSHQKYINNFNFKLLNTSLSEHQRARSLVEKQGERSKPQVLGKAGEETNQSGQNCSTEAKAAAGHCS